MKEKIIQALKNVIDPELGFNVYDLGLIYQVETQQNHCKITMTLSTKSCPLHDLIISWVKEAALSVPDCKECEINLVWEPMWDIQMASDDIKKSLGF